MWEVLMAIMLRRLAGLTVAAVALSMGQSARADLSVPSNSTVSTVSYAEIDTTTDTRVSQTVQRYATELDFGLAGQPALSSQTYFVAASDPVFQAAINAAAATLLGSGSSSTTGPTLVSSSTSSTTVYQTVETGRSTSQTVSTGRFVGPTTLTSGDLGICQSATLLNTSPGLSGGTSPSNQYPLLSGCVGGSPSQVTLAFGAIDFDSLILTSAAITTTTTGTTTNTLNQVYRINGIVSATVSVPEPRSFAVLTISLLMLGGIGSIRTSRDGSV